MGILKFILVSIFVFQVNAASARELKQTIFYWPMHNGASLTFDVQDEKIFFTDSKGLVSVVSEHEAAVFPAAYRGKKAYESITYNDDNGLLLTRANDKAALIWNIKDELIIVNHLGVRVSFMPPKAFEDASISETQVQLNETKKIGDRTYQYVLLSVDGNPDYRLAILFDDNCNYEMVSVPAMAPKPVWDVKNRVLRDGTTKFDLTEISKRMDAPKRSQLVDISVQDNEGDKASALEIISTFTENLTERFTKSPLTDIVIDEANREKIYTTLLKKQYRSLVLLGEAGTGKTTTAEAIASELANDLGPKSLADYHVIYLDAAGIEAGGKYTGSVETKAKAIIELSKRNKIIWVVDEMHSLKGRGTHSHQENDIFETLKLHLANGTLTFVGTSTEHQFDGAFKGDTTITDRFTRINLSEPEGDQLRGVLKNWLKQRKLVEPSDEILSEVVKISTDFNAQGAQPRKSILLLEQIYASMEWRSKTDTAPTLEDVRTAAVSLYQTDPAHFDATKLRAKIEHLKEYLDSRHIGHDEAKSAVVLRAMQAYSGFNDKDKPRMKVLLAGPRGQGKTDLAIAYAEGMGLKYKVIEFNGYSEGTGLKIDVLESAAEALFNDASTVLIFDEIEKAPTEVQNQVLRLMNEGKFTVTVTNGNSGHKISKLVFARNATVFLTTNAGIESSGMGSIGFTESAASPLKRREELEDRLSKDGISSPFLDRVDDIYYLQPPTKEEFEAIFQVHLGRTIKSLNDRGIKIVMSDFDRASYARAITDREYRANMSNRVVKRVLDEELRTDLALAAWAEKLNASSENALTFDNQGLKINGETTCRELLASGKSAKAS